MNVDNGGATCYRFGNMDMKRFIKHYGIIVALLIIIPVAFVLTSCGKSGQEYPYAGHKLVGIWSHTNEQNITRYSFTTDGMVTASFGSNNGIEWEHDYGFFKITQLGTIYHVAVEWYILNHDAKAEPVKTAFFFYFSDNNTIIVDASQDVFVRVV